MRISLLIFVFFAAELLGLSIIWAADISRGEGMAALLWFTHLIAVLGVVWAHIFATPKIDKDL